MKTQKEILNKIEEVKSDDFMGTKRSDMVDFLDFENAKEFLKEGVKREEWEKDGRFDGEMDEKVKDEMLKYLPFAWDKANDKRGLSACRSIEHFEAWIWLLGDEELQKKFDDTEYEHYGKEKLVVVSEHFGFDWKKEDDGHRDNS